MASKARRSAGRGIAEQALLGLTQPTGQILTPGGRKCTQTVDAVGSLAKI